MIQSMSDVINHIWHHISRVNDRDTGHIDFCRRPWPSVFRSTSVKLLLFISFCNAFLSRRYVFQSASGDLEIMTIFLRSDRYKLMLLCYWPAQDRSVQGKAVTEVLKMLPEGSIVKTSVTVFPYTDRS